MKLTALIKLAPIMVNHFELAEINQIAAVIRSNIWVGNERLIGILIKKLIYYNERQNPIPQTIEFWNTILQEPNQLFSPVINRQTLQILVESRLWILDQHLISFIFNEFIHLSDHDQVNFGTAEFWAAVFEENFDEQVGAGRPITDFYEIGQETTLRVRRFNSEARGYTIRLRNIDQISPNLIPKIFNDILRQLLRQQDLKNRVGLELRHPSLDKSILVPFTTVEAMNSDRILAVIENIQQSKQQFKLDEDIFMKLVIVGDSSL